MPCMGQPGGRIPSEETDCILCGSGERTVLSVRGGWPVCLCRICGLVYLSPRPSRSALAEIYGREYYEDGTTGYRGYEESFERHAGAFARIFARRAADLESRVRGRRLLEVGCAHGFLLDFLRSRGWSVAGVEVSPLSSSYARDRFGLDVATGTLEALAGTLPGGYDAILMLDVLEHLHTPFETLSAAAGLLAPGGTLVVQCPWELSHWEETMQAVLRGMAPGTIEPDSVPAHLYFFSPRTLEAVLEKGGFRITGRQSGNYGEIRRRISPPRVLTGSPAEVVFRLLYHRLGARSLLYGLSRRLGLGNGIIRYAEPAGRA